jgi:ABC-type branched-subunit amino acid transport system substrate-binding protein
MRWPLLVLVACGPKVAPEPWTERESHARAPLGQGHETPVATGGAKVDLSKIDPDTADEPTVLAALAQVGDRAPAAALALRAARLAHHRGDDAEARALVARAASAADEPKLHAQLSALAVELAEPPVDPATIAVLLPLTGRFAPLGGELRAAIELAPAGGTHWLFVDTKGEPDGAAAAIAIARGKGAIAILGPVGTREALAAARGASLAQIPIALLAPGDGADPSAGVFRLASSPGDEGRAVARIAHQENFPTVAVFAPRDDVGGEAADAFAAEATRLGLSVTARGSYDPTGGDLEPDVKQLLELVPAKNERLAEHLRKDPKHGWQTFSPDIPFSLLYIPDRYDRAAIVAAFLPYFNVELRTTEFPDPQRLARKHHGRIPQVVQLVGGAGWHHPSLPVRGGTAVQGALIVDDCAAETAGDTGAHFVADFQQKTGHPPSSAASQAFDAAALVATARATAAGARDPRAALRDTLARGKLDDGACGPAAVGADGELARTPSILEVSGDELIVAP